MSMFGQLASNPATGKSAPGGSSQDLINQAGGGNDAPPGATTQNTTTQDYIGPAGYQLSDTFRAHPMTVGLADDYAQDLAPQYRMGDELTPLKDSWLPERIA